MSGGIDPTRDGPGGYRMSPRGGAAIRSDIVDVYIFRVAREGDSKSAEFLQLLRAGAPLEATWQPVMGHVEKGESAVACARRELEEEVGLRAGNPAWLGFWALEQVHPFYLARIDSIVMSPRLAARVDFGWTPTLNSEHSAHRWVLAADVGALFMWPGQKRACAEVLDEILRPGSLSEERMRLAMEPPAR